MRCVEQGKSLLLKNDLKKKTENEGLTVLDLSISLCLCLCFFLGRRESFYYFFLGGGKVFDSTTSSLLFLFAGGKMNLCADTRCSHILSRFSSLSLYLKSFFFVISALYKSGKWRDAKCHFLYYYNVRILPSLSIPLASLIVRLNTCCPAGLRMARLLLCVAV